MHLTLQVVLHGGPEHRSLVPRLLFRLLVPRLLPQRHVLRIPTPMRRLPVRDRSSEGISGLELPTILAFAALHILFFRVLGLV